MRPIPNTITDPDMDRLFEVEESLPPTAEFNDYQKAASQTAIYPRVYTEGQVRDLLTHAYIGGSQYAMENSRVLVAKDFQYWIDVDLDESETPFNRLVYPVLGLLGEAGEIANKLKKVARDDQGQMDMDKSVEIQAELGDVLWYVSQVATELKTPLERIAFANIRKLFGRKSRGVLGGSGDTR